jgi:hypothetical protein
VKTAVLVLNVALTAVFAAGSVRAGCIDDVSAARHQLASIKDEAQRQELSRLLDKAEKDALAGRERLCLDALVRAQALIK